MIATRDGAGIRVRVFERAAACGTPSASDLPGEHSLLISLKLWPVATNGTRATLPETPGVAVNAMKTEGGGGSSSALSGTLEVVSSTPAGGTIVVHAHNEHASLDGPVPFALCN